MKKTLYITTTLVIAILLINSCYLSNNKKIEFKVTNSDRTIYEGDIKNLEFDFYNYKKESLNIDRIVSTCPCLEVMDYDKKVYPNETGKIIVQFDSSNLNGEVDRYLLVYFKEFEEPESLNISVNVFRKYKTSENFILATTSDNDSYLSGEIFLTSDYNPKFKIIDYTFELAGCDVDLLKIESGYKVTVKYDNKDFEGYKAYKLKLLLSDGNKKEIDCLFRKIKDITVFPMALFIDNSKEVSRVIKVKSKENFINIDVGSIFNGLNYEVKEVREGHDYNIHLKIKKNYPLIEDNYFKFNILSKGKLLKKVIIPINLVEKD